MADLGHGRAGERCSSHSVRDHADERFSSHSVQASAIVRHLGFVGVALVWLFGSGGANPGLEPEAVLARIHTSPALALALALVVAALFLDLLQYAWGSAAWGSFHWTLDQVLNGQATDAREWRGRLAWRLAKMSTLKRQLDFELGLLKEGDKTRPSVYETVRALSSTGSEVIGQWSPAWINLITNIMFFSKLVAIIGSYVSLLIFVTST